MAFEEKAKAGDHTGDIVHTCAQIYCQTHRDSCPHSCLGRWQVATTTTHKLPPNT